MSVPTTRFFDQTHASNYELVCSVSLARARRGSWAGILSPPLCGLSVRPAYPLLRTSTDASDVKASL